MNKFNNDILNLIKCALNGETPVCKDLDYKQILSFAKKQQIVGLLFYSLSKIEDFKNSEEYKEFFVSYVNNLKNSENQLYELNVLFNIFNENGIEYFPLKGAILKSIYPKSDMRTMGDGDILIRKKQLKKIKKIMLTQGFSFKGESDHECIWKKDNVTIELHKSLIPSYNKDYFSYYGDGWKLIKNNQMSKEDIFVYLFTHFSKHYRDKGIGIKYIIDLYVYLNYYKNLNKKYIEQELKKLKLYEFYLNVLDTIDGWFNGKELTEKGEYITDFIFSCLVYGKEELLPVSDALKISKGTSNVKGRRLMTRLFPPYELMVIYYKFLRPLPFLLPVMYVYRFFHAIITKPKRVGQDIKELKNYNKEQIDAYQKDLNYVGLDFNFEKNKKKEKKNGI
ncbi:MAG: nucleotidyltransferase family protein [Clostridia bacterium]|nr:nucleotidyltransferase family protein [Clostridia bacterium]